MSYKFGYNLTPYSERIIEALYTYRGMTAKQLAAIINATFMVDLTREKSTYNYLRKLKVQGLVTASKLQGNVVNGSLYYLTYNGFMCAKDILNINEGQEGTGWIQPYQEYEETTLADFQYKVHLPPQRQLAHHLMLIDFFIQAKRIEEDFDTVKHRSNLYAARTYYLDGEKCRFRPDAEVMVGGKRFGVEIDRSTESHEKIVEKFEVYKRYLDYCSKTEDPMDDLNGIYFVVENKRRDHGIKRRWASVLSAFFKVLWKYQNKLNLILTTVDSIRETLLFELHREELEGKAQEAAKKYLLNHGFSNVMSWHDVKTKETVFTHGINPQYYQVLFNPISQGFESRLYIYSLYRFLREQVSIC